MRVCVCFRNFFQPCAKVHTWVLRLAILISEALRRRCLGMPVDLSLKHSIACECHKHKPTKKVNLGGCDPSQPLANCGGQALWDPLSANSSTADNAFDCCEFSLFANGTISSTDVVHHCRSEARPAHQRTDLSPPLPRPVHRHAH